MTVPPELPIACNLDAMNAEQRIRHQLLWQQLAAAREEIRELADGYGFRLPANPAIVSLAAAWMTLEQLCCPFFQFDLRLTAAQGPVWLELTGREGVKQLLQTELGLR